MAKLFDKLMNRIISGKLEVEDGDVVSKEAISSAVGELSPVKLEVSNVESISSKDLDALKCGDVVIKKTGNQRHSYKVSYKENGQGICLTYSDASCVETISYDKVGDSWVFNSKDVYELPNENTDLVVKTLSQSEANWSVDLSEASIEVPNGFSATNIFSRLQVINKELEIVFSFKVANEQSGPATPGYARLGEFEVPSEIGSKIIDMVGDDLTKTPASAVAIAGSSMVVSGSDVPFADFNVRNGVLTISHSDANKLKVSAVSLQSMTLGATHTYSGRIQLTLL